MPRRFVRRFVVAGIGLLLLAASAQVPTQAQDYPNRPITLLVGLAAGGITDITSRLYAEAASKISGQRITVENRTGAGGGVAASAVQNAAPDGYTLLVFSGSQHATIPASGNAPYEPVKGFSPVTFLFNSVVVLTVPADSSAKTMAELHDLGRKKPGGLTFGTPGLGSPSHLLGAKILIADKVPFETAHYRGGAPMMADLITGRVDFSWPTLSTSRAYLADKKLRALALDADARWAPLPDVPTLTELGFGKEKVASWFALAAPAKTPPEVVSKIRELFVKASQDPDLKRRLEENGTPILTSTSEQMGAAMEQEWQTMQQLAKTLNLKPQ
jgi:tripartite-type tricarboxylate transporter receptor subunit TctC